eukprot:TRINITY_DN5614_c0_g1_i2.p1 TRINITY_DN5614_c0_g1~~TRINITY_DN5614_c0_g1_i2.p1  ORF type:complete len:210 (-),score=55.97 TRINITY_DN5614_c0_g1_i2:158-787(-)
MLKTTQTYLCTEMPAANDVNDMIPLVLAHTKQLNIAAAPDDAADEKKAQEDDIIQLLAAAHAQSQKEKPKRAPRTKAAATGRGRKSRALAKGSSDEDAGEGEGGGDADAPAVKMDSDEGQGEGAAGRKRGATTRLNGASEPVAKKRKTTAAPLACGKPRRSSAASHVQPLQISGLPKSEPDASAAATPVKKDDSLSSRLGKWGKRVTKT